MLVLRTSWRETEHAVAESMFDFTAAYVNAVFRAGVASSQSADPLEEVSIAPTTHTIQLTLPHSDTLTAVSLCHKNLLLCSLVVGPSYMLHTHCRVFPGYTFSKVQITSNSSAIFVLLTFTHTFDAPCFMLKMQSDLMQECFSNS